MVLLTSSAFATSLIKETILDVNPTVIDPSIVESESGMTPDHPIYFLDKLGESIQLGFSNKEKKQELRMQIAEERLGEILALSKKNTSKEKIDVAEMDLEKELSDATTQADNDKSFNFSEKLLRHQMILESIYLKAPNNVSRAAIERNIIKTQMHYETLEQKKLCNDLKNTKTDVFQKMECKKRIVIEQQKNREELKAQLKLDIAALQEKNKVEIEKIKSEEPKSECKCSEGYVSSGEVCNPTCYPKCLSPSVKCIDNSEAKLGVKKLGEDSPLTAEEIADQKFRDNERARFELDNKLREGLAE